MGREEQLKQAQQERLARDRAKILWCVHILGPDELVPQASYEAAEKHAADLLAFMYSPAMPAGEFAPMFLPIVTMWPYSAESHAKELARLADTESGGQS